MADREMSLDEWVARLPPHHRAHGELRRLRANVERLQGDPLEDEGTGAMSERWRPVTEDEPREFRTVLFYRASDLYPVVGWRMYGEGEWHWYLWEGGEEDRENQQYPGIGGGDGWAATHWMPLEELEPVPAEGQR